MGAPTNRTVVFDGVAWGWTRPVAITLGIAFSVPAVALEPLLAKYQVYDGKGRVGEATMQVVRQDDLRWRIDVDVRATRGLTGWAGATFHQGTVFDVTSNTFRPLEQNHMRRAARVGRQTTAVFDWGRGVARWRAR